MYTDSEFRGTVTKVRSDVTNFKSLNVNDKISSLKCGPGVNVELYVDSNFKGESQRYSGDVKSFGKFNDKFSSIRFL